MLGRSSLVYVFIPHSILRFQNAEHAARDHGSYEVQAVKQNVKKRLTGAGTPISTIAAAPGPDLSCELALAKDQRTGIAAGRMTTRTSETHPIERGRHFPPTLVCAQSRLRQADRDHLVAVQPRQDELDAAVLDGEGQFRALRRRCYGLHLAGHGHRDR